MKILKYFVTNINLLFIKESYFYCIKEWTINNR